MRMALPDPGDWRQLAIQVARLSGTGKHRMGIISK